jgi:thiol reductant ABC exporter CydD subunit
MATPSRLWTAAPAARWWLRGAVGLGVLAGLAWVGVLVGIALVVAAVFIGGATGASVGPAVVAIAGLVVVRAAFVGLAGGAAQMAASLVTAGERRRIADALRARHPLVTLGDRSGELVHVVTADVDGLDGYVGRYLPARTLAVAMPLLVAAVIGVIDPLTLPILLFTGPLLIITLALIGRTTEARTRRREHELAWLDGHFLDMVRGLPTLRLFGRADEQAATIETVARRLASSSLDVLRTAFQTSLVLEWGATAATALVAITVSIRLMAGDLPFERALAVLLLTPECFVPVRRLAAQYHVGAAGRVALGSIEAASAATETAAGAAAPGVLPSPAPAPTPVPRHAPAIRVHHLRVTYPDRDEPVLDDASFELEPRRLTVIAGPTGAGKTTILAVLLRFLEPSAGRIDVDGADLATMDATEWRRRIAWMPQHPHLFDGTIAEALRLGRRDARETVLRAAAAAAAVDDVIDALPEGYGTRLGEDGARLSGGEIARLALARAFVRGAPLLIVDEPTAHLDAATAARVRDSLRAAAVTSTVVAVSHDPELAEIADRVLVLEDGRLRPRPTGEHRRRSASTPVSWTAPARRGAAASGGPSVSEPR